MLSALGPPAREYLRIQRDNEYSSSILWNRGPDVVEVAHLRDHWKGGVDKKSERACKPGSVLLAQWRSFICDTCRHVPVATYPEAGASHACCQAARFPIWSCSGWGLPCHRCWSARCALTAPFHPYLAGRGRRGGIFSVALSVGSRPPGVTWHPALWSPDFPPMTGVATRPQRSPSPLAAAV